MKLENSGTVHVQLSGIQFACKNPKMNGTEEKSRTGVQRNAFPEVLTGKLNFIQCHSTGNRLHRLNDKH
jgi:hypothetical protein